MRFRKQPRIYDRVMSDNSVVTYINEIGVAIVKNDLGDLYYFECEEEFAEPGTVVPVEDLRSIEDLNNANQALIYKRLNKK